MAESLPHSIPRDVAKGDLVLQILGGPRDGQVVRLRSAKCTIGSSPNCSLRVVARGVRPVHCLVLRGDQATLARSWAPDTRLNGKTFTDAPLVPGDLLSIGPVDFKVLECPAVLESQLRAREAALEGRLADFEALQSDFQ